MSMMVTICGSSRFLSELVRRDPGLLDSLVTSVPPREDDGYRVPASAWGRSRNQQLLRIGTDDLLGLTTANLFIRYPKLDEAIGFRISYLPSNYFYKREKSPIKIANDYSGQTYFADIKWKGFLEALGRPPGFARYLLSGVHFSTLHYRCPDMCDATTCRNELRDH